MKHALTALAALAALASACGTSTTEDVTPTPTAVETTEPAPTQPEEALSGTLDLTLFGDATETAGYQKMVEQFMAANPGVTVNLSPVAKQDDLLAKLTTEFAAGSPPDVFLINYRKYGQFAAEGALAPVQSYLDSSSAISADDYYQTSFDAFRYDGEELTCMPQNLSSLQVYYNADVFEAAGVDAPKAGWTWDDFLTTAKALTEGDMFGVGTDPSVIRVAPFVWSNGGEVVDDPINPTTLTLDQGKAREALDWFLDLRLEHGVTPGDAEEQSEDSESRFIRGGLGMYLDSRKVVPGFREIDAFEWDVAPLPVAPGGSPATILHADAYCMSAAGQPDLAWKLIEFAMGPEGQAILAESGRTVPSRKDVANSPAYLDPSKPPASAKVWLDAADSIRAVPHIASWSKVEKEAGKILEEIYYGRLDREQGIADMIATTAPLFSDGG